MKESCCISLDNDSMMAFQSASFQFLGMLASGSRCCLPKYFFSLWPAMPLILAGTMQGLDKINVSLSLDAE